MIRLRTGFLLICLCALYTHYIVLNEIIRRDFNCFYYFFANRRLAMVSRFVRNLSTEQNFRAVLERCTCRWDRFIRPMIDFSPTSSVRRRPRTETVHGHNLPARPGRSVVGINARGKTSIAVPRALVPGGEPISSGRTIYSNSLRYIIVLRVVFFPRGPPLASCAR